MKLPEAMKTLKDAMHKDFDYAWGWHCNIACMSADEGLSHGASNRAAARVMRLAFDVDTSATAFINYMKSTVGKEGELEDDMER